MGASAGTVLMGRYVLQRELGSGGMGSVWLARQRVLDAPVAVKLIAEDLSGKEASQRFLQEARLAAGLSSPHVVRLFDYGVEGGLAFLVMELLEGQTLGALLRREGTLGPALTADLVTQICRGIGTAHAAGIVHRDLKPYNIFLVRNDGEYFVKVLDFGVAKASSPPERASQPPSGLSTQSGMVLGTGPYMSPEQWDDPRNVTPQSDLWSIGVIAYQCLLGELPFQGATLSALVTAIAQRPPPIPSEHGPVPAGFDAWFARCVDRQPRVRFTDAREAAQALNACCRSELASSDPMRAHAQQPTLPTLVNSQDAEGAQEIAPPPSQASRGASRGNRRRSLLVSLALVAAGLAAVLALALWPGDSMAPAVEPATVPEALPGSESFGGAAARAPEVQEPEPESTAAKPPPDAGRGEPPTPSDGLAAPQAPEPKVPQPKAHQRKPSRVRSSSVRARPTPTKSGARGGEREPESSQSDKAAASPTPGAPPTQPQPVPSNPPPKPPTAPKKEAAPLFL